MLRLAGYTRVAAVAILAVGIWAQQPKTPAEEVAEAFAYINRQVLDMAKDFPARAPDHQSAPHRTVFGCDRLLWLSRLGPLPRSGPQGWPGRRSRVAQRDGRARAGARHLPGHRGDRRRPLADALRARRGAGGGGLWRRAHLVSH